MASWNSRLKNLGIVSLLALVMPVTRGTQQPADYVAGSLVQLNDNGAWSWFMDEGVIVDQGKLIVGSVRSLGDFDATQNQPDWGNVEVSVYDIATGRAEQVVLDRHFEQDDHDALAFLALPDGRYLAVYTRHADERKICYRGETADGGAHWRWQPITANSTVDNLRPLVPKWKDARTALVWMRGPSYTHYHGNWTTAVVALILPPKAR
jgi:hypothetical protein